MKYVKGVPVQETAPGSGESSSTFIMEPISEMRQVTHGSETHQIKQRGRQQVGAPLYHDSLSHCTEGHGTYHLVVYSVEVVGDRSSGPGYIPS